MSIKERPIIFDAESVRAILEGRKTQTRRVLRWPTWAHPADSGEDLGNDPPCIAHRETGCLVTCKCRHGQPGDRLWVRESFDAFDDPAADKRDIKRKVWNKEECHTERWVVDYRADGNHHRIMDKIGTRRWKSPIHMPRWASRITLEITEVRVEPLQEISYDDVLAEGVEPVKNGPHANQYYREDTGALFVDRWDKINGKRFPWASNPWVWVITFRRLEPNA